VGWGVKELQTKSEEACQRRRTSSWHRVQTNEHVTGMACPSVCFIFENFRISMKFGIESVNRESSVSILTGYGLDDRGSIPCRGWEFYSSPPRPDRPWDPPSLLSNKTPGALSLVLKRPGA
jgi:hypothetical protein